MLPDGQAVTLDTGHFVRATQPDEFIDHLLAFLDS
jgi:sugar phosphate isomerase/epimerase